MSKSPSAKFLQHIEINKLIISEPLASAVMGCQSDDSATGT